MTQQKKEAYNILNSLLKYRTQLATTKPATFNLLSDDVKRYNDAVAQLDIAIKAVQKITTL
jgi:hypothetical protein